MPRYPECYHCHIEIKPAFDEAHRVRLDGGWVTVCDPCRNDFMVFGESFGDDVRGECLHTKWAAEDVAARQLEVGETA